MDKLVITLHFERCLCQTEKCMFRYKKGELLMSVYEDMIEPLLTKNSQRVTLFPVEYPKF